MIDWLPFLNRFDVAIEERNPTSSHKLFSPQSTISLFKHKMNSLRKFIGNASIITTTCKYKVVSMHRVSQIVTFYS